MSTLAIPGAARKRGIFCLIALLLISLAAAVDARPSNKWRLQFSGGADSDGVITIKIIPKEGEPFVTETAIKAGTGENKVAKTVVKSLKAQLPKKRFHVERDDGEDVLIKRKWGEPYFDVEIVSITVKGVRINPDRE